MARSPSRFNRPGGRYLPQPVVLVICEDKKSGKRYLEDAAIYFRVNVLVRVSHVGKTDPLGIVEEAIAQQKKFDRIFCVIDRDDHPSFDEALRRLRGHDKVVAIPSYPCFEFWFLLHFGFTRKPYRSMGANSAASQLISDLCRYPETSSYDKGSDNSYFQLLVRRFAEARAQSPRVLAAAIEDGDMNPSTRLHELLDFYEKLSRPLSAAAAEPG